MNCFSKSTKALFALAFGLMLLAGGYGTAWAQQAGEKAAPKTEDGATMQEMMENCPMMQDEAMMRQMMENCPMMQQMMQHMESCPMMKGMMRQEGMMQHEGMEDHEGMMQDREKQGDGSSQTGQSTSSAKEGAAPVRLAALPYGEQAADDVQIVKVTVGPNGYEPKQIELKSGVPARLIFTRTTDATCAKQIQAPELGVKKTDLPLNKPVTVEFTPKEDGAYSFACGMNMLKGAIIVKS